MSEQIYRKALEEHLGLFSKLNTLMDDLVRAAGYMLETIKNGGKIMICGNGGSAADAQHFAAEMVGRFQLERRPWGAVALTTDTSILTAVGNDYSFEEIFARQVEALASPGDLFLGISTSGRSENVLKAALCARTKGIKTVGLLGNDGGPISRSVDSAVIVPYNVTARIQEVHVFILHVWSEMIESGLAGHRQV
ncbi:MAG: D-sedoheptulose 7-phosphate isomerase [Syntrophobacteraceae bacterium]